MKFSDYGQGQTLMTRCKRCKNICSNKHNLKFMPIPLTSMSYILAMMLSTDINKNTKEMLCFWKITNTFWTQNRQKIPLNATSWTIVYKSFNQLHRSMLQNRSSRNSIVYIHNQFKYATLQVRKLWIWINVGALMYTKWMIGTTNGYHHPILTFNSEQNYRRLKGFYIHTAKNNERKRSPNEFLFPW